MKETELRQMVREELKSKLVNEAEPAGTKQLDAKKVLAGIKKFQKMFGTKAQLDIRKYPKSIGTHATVYLPKGTEKGSSEQLKKHKEMIKTIRSLKLPISNLDSVGGIARFWVQYGVDESINEGSNETEALRKLQDMIIYMGYISNNSEYKSNARRVTQEIEKLKKLLQKNESVNEARAPKTISELEKAIKDAETKRDKLQAKTGAPGGGAGYSSGSAEGKKNRAIDKRFQKLTDDIHRWSDKLKKLKKESVNEAKKPLKKGDKVIVDKVTGGDSKRFKGKKGTVIGIQGNYVSVNLKGFSSPDIEFHRHELKLDEATTRYKSQDEVSYEDSKGKVGRGTITGKTGSFYIILPDGKKQSIKVHMSQVGKNMYEAALNEAFWRLSNDTGLNALYVIKELSRQLYDKVASGQDYDPNLMKYIVDKVKEVKKHTKKFNKKEDVVGTAFEGKRAKSVNEGFEKSAIQKALKDNGYDLKQSDVKMGQKKESGGFIMYTLNGVVIGSNDYGYKELIQIATDKIKKDPKKYKLKEAMKNLKTEALSKRLDNPIMKSKEGLKTWWKHSKEDLMSFVYWTKRQIPPSSKSSYDKQWKLVVKQLHDKFPAPVSDYKKKIKESGILYKAGIKKYGKEGMTKILSAAGKKASHAEIGAIKDKYEKDKKESNG